MYLGRVERCLELRDVGSVRGDSVDFGDEPLRGGVGLSHFRGVEGHADRVVVADDRPAHTRRDRHPISSDHQRRRRLVLRRG